MITNLYTNFFIHVNNNTRSFNIVRLCKIVRKTYSENIIYNINHGFFTS